MQFLLDENMPPSLVGLLHSAGYEARHMIEVGYNNTPDFKITEFAGALVVVDEQKIKVRILPLAP